MASLLDEYMNAAPALIECYSGAPGDLFTKAPATRPWDSNLVEGIRAYNDALGHHPVFSGDEAVIITGQQPAIFAGPLYSVYKAITCIKLAEELSKKTNTPVVPVYWVGSEDHDFDEAATVYFPTRKHTTDKVTLECPPEHIGRSLHRIPVTEQVDALISDLLERGPGGEFRDDIEGFLRESATASDSLADWSTRILARLFRDTPLIFFAPHLAAARCASSSVIQAAIENPLTTSHAVNEGAQKMESLGYPAQVVKNEDECGFFYEVDGVRNKVLYRDDTFHLPDLNTTITKEELLETLEADSERFSPNVALRCVVQQHLFPVSAYVAGPGELAYWGQFKGVFEAFDHPMPIVYPRAHAVLTSIKLNKLLSKYSLSPTDLLGQKDELLQSCLRTITDSPEIERTQAANQETNTAIKTLADDLRANAPTAANMATNLAEDLERKFAKLENNLLLSDTKRRETVEGHLQRLQQCLAPNRKPQERMHTVVPYLFEQGWGLLDILMQNLETGNTTLNEVEL
ncbi:MAG: bacillithiol biosynthesis cysteine-adding enzyme BshC [Candidatus Hydrogenedentota bacterium]